MKVEMVVLGSPSLISLMVAQCGRKATLKQDMVMAELRSYVKVETDMAALGSPSLIVNKVSYFMGYTAVLLWKIYPSCHLSYYVQYQLHQSTVVIRRRP